MKVLFFPARARARASVASKTFESSSYHQKKEAFWLILQTFGDISHPHKLPFLAPIKARYKSKTMFAFLELFLEYYYLETRKAALLSNMYSKMAERYPKLSLSRQLKASFMKGLPDISQIFLGTANRAHFAL